MPVDGDADARQGVGPAASLASVLMVIMPEEVGLRQGDGDADDGPGVGLICYVGWACSGTWTGLEVMRAGPSQPVLVGPPLDL